MLNIQKIATDRIKPAAYNPRKDLKPGDPAYDRLKKAMDSFGLVEPLVWNQRTGNLVGGHQRFKILIEDPAVTEIPVSVVDLDDRDEKALNLALNKHAGEWDFATLADLVQELDAGDLDMEVTGFSAEDLEELATWTPEGSSGGGAGGGSTKLADRFMVPPFSVLNAREGWWQDRKQAWIALGIQSELGRGAAPGGSLMPGVGKDGTIVRTDSHARPIEKGRRASRNR